ncbi:fungal-specific transcription factor domain-containing protein [Aspergillus californicus]
MSLLRKLNPEVDIENALETIARNPDSPGAPGGELSQDSGLDVESSHSPHRFEWNESSLATDTDGMASLPSRMTDSGYLGNSSGTSLLETISDLLPEDSSTHDHRHPERVSQTGSPSLLIHFANTAVLDNLVDAYFLWYNRSYPILHEETFREKYRNRHQIHARSNWHLIFHLVLAIGHWTTTGGSELDQCRYYMAARSHMSMRMLESGNLLAVQAFLLMGNYLQKRDRPNTGYNYIGIAYRMALGLGLHREPPPQVNDTISSERQRVLWWIVYCFDSGFSITTGRPIMASDTFIETRLPQNIDDSTCTLDTPLVSCHPASYPTSYSAIIALTRLVSIGNRIFSDIISTGPHTQRPPFNLKTSRSIDHQLKAWKLSLPSYFTVQDVPAWFRGPRAVVRWKEQNLRMLLWWGSQRLCNTNPNSNAHSTPGLDPNPERSEAINICHFAAVETIQDITTFCCDHSEVIHAGLSWYATYFLFQASIVLSIHHLQPLQPFDSASGSGSGSGLANVDHDLWLPSISRAGECLETLGRTNKAASRCLAVLDRITARSRPQEPQPSMNSQAHTQPHQVYTNPEIIPETGDTSMGPLAIDPTLQVFFENTSWENDLFEGLHGFPGTNEVDLFDYDPGSNSQAMHPELET